VRVLVTGSAGHIGREQVKVLQAAGYEVRTTDRVAAQRGDDWEHLPGDLRDLDFIRRAVQGMDAVAHLGAIASDRRGASEDVMAVNVQGTWNVLLAAQEAGVPRVVAFSSINALGCVGGHRPAQYLPIDDAYPHHPLSPYQLSKHIGEEICRYFSEKFGMVTICLRPAYVAAPDHYKSFRDYPVEIRAEGSKVEYWGYVDRRDVCEATLLSLTVENVLHDAFLLFADDTILDTPTLEAVEKHYPDTPWKQDKAAYFADNPYRSMFDCSHAKQVLGWQPKHSWREAFADQPS
jgi:UDP-glucose 4-epimerase